MRLFTVFFAFCVLCTYAIAGTGVPRPYGGEPRIKIINYTPNTVFRYVGHYEYQSIIEFDINETIETITMGTQGPWQMIPTGNRIFLKPIEDNATTNMTVITDKRMYFFEMHAEEATGVSDKDLSFIVKFVYPKTFSNTGNGSIINKKSNLGAGNIKTFAKAKDYEPKLNTPELYNFNYTVSGDAFEIEPIRVFDDGEFTYFEFRDLNSEIPAIFLVDSQGQESLVNYRITNKYIVVERVTDRFTLRHGSDVICIFNEQMERAKKALKSKKDDMMKKAESERRAKRKKDWF